MSIAALVLGILSIIGSIIGAANPLSNTITIIALVVGVIAIVLAAIGMKKSEKHGMAVAGLVLSIIAIVVSVIMLIACGGTKQAVNDAVNTAIEQGVNAADMSEEELQSVVDDLGAQIEEALGDAAN